MKKLIIIVVLVGLTFGAIFIVKKRKAELTSIKPSTRHAFHVKTTKVKLSDFSKMDKVFGSVETFNSANIISRVQGQVTKIYKREGDLVKKGEKIVELDNLIGLKKSLIKKLSTVKKQLSNIETTINNLKQSYQRDEKLYNSKAISLEMLQISENKLNEVLSKKDLLTSQYAEVKAQISFFTITSPYNGIIGQLFVKQGDIALLGKPVIRIENTNKYKVGVTVDSENLTKIKKGGNAKLLFNEQKLVVTVSRVFPSINFGKGTVEIDLDSLPFNLPTGSFIDVEIETEKYLNVLTVPENSLLRLDNNAIIFKLKDNLNVSPVKVKVLTISKGIAAIKGDFKQGDLVVVASETILLRLSKDSKVITE